jgi:MoaA/NifB/PqqE/SkfB family radical SAM enzyme
MPKKVIGACWVLTSRCNLLCPVCSAYRVENDSTLDGKRKILNKLVSFGINKIMFSGGEPLLDPDVMELINFAKNLGLKTALSTNGLLLNADILSKLDTDLDELALPLDGSTAEINALTRINLGHYEKVIDILKLSSQYSFSVEVGTVVSRVNYKDLNNIFHLINKYISKWKLFHFYPISRGIDKNYLFNLEIDEFNKIVDYWTTKYPDFSIDFRYGLESIMRSYFYISPNGNFIGIKDGQYYNGGSILNINDLHHFLIKNNFNFMNHSNRHWRDF